MCFLTVIIVFRFPWRLAGVWLAGAFFIPYPVWYGKPEQIPDHRKLFIQRAGVHIFRQPAAQAADKLIFICHVSVPVAFLVNGIVNYAVHLFFDGKGKVCKQHGYPEFLHDGIHRAAAEIRKPYFFFDELVIFFHRPPQEGKPAEHAPVKVGSGIFDPSMAITCSPHKPINRAWKLRESAL